MLDYAGLEVEVTGPAQHPPALGEWIHWPADEDIHWSDGPDNLLVNGGLSETDGILPAGWHPSGDGAVYLPERVVAEGTGAFVQDRRVDLFRPDTPVEPRAVRPLDFLQVDHADEASPGATSSPGSKQTAACGFGDTRPSRRRVSASVLRRSGCLAVPGAAVLRPRELQGGHRPLRVSIRAV